MSNLHKRAVRRAKMLPEKISVRSWSGANHYVHYQHADEVAEAALQWLRQELELELASVSLSSKL